MRRSLFISSLLFFALACNRDARPVLNGRVEAYLTDLAPRSGGRLMELKVVEGQRVKQGDLLARVIAEELDAAVNRDQAALQSAEAKRLEFANGTRSEEIAQGQAKVHDAEAALKLAQENFGRAQRLFNEGVSSQAELDRAQSERDRAAANLNLQAKGLAELRAGARREQRLGVNADEKRAKATLTQTEALAKFTEIRAPFDGVIVHRLREVGSVVNAGAPVLTVARLDQLWVRVYLPQSLQSQATLKQEVTVYAPSRGEFSATLDEISSEPEYTPKMVETREERVNLVYPARVHLANGWDKGLIPGLAVDVKLGAPKPGQNWAAQK
jgi:HlyD family secretion protein